MRGGFQISAHLKDTLWRQDLTVLQPFTQAEQAVAQLFGGFRCQRVEVIELSILEAAYIHFVNQRTEDGNSVSVNAVSVLVII